MNGATMRTLGFRTHLVLTLVACAGVAAALGMPWSGAAQAGGQYLDGPMDRTPETSTRTRGRSSHPS
jgi:hypothetical protein